MTQIATVSMRDNAKTAAVIVTKLTFGLHVACLNSCYLFHLFAQLPDYLYHVDRRLSQEHERIVQYLHKTTK